MPKQYLTVNEVARLLGVSPLTVRNWDQKGRLEAYRNPINNYRLYKITDVEKLLTEIDSSRENKNKVKNFSISQKKLTVRVAEILPEEKPPFKKLKIEME